jgi:hypothetical protein
VTSCFKIVIKSVVKAYSKMVSDWMTAVRFPVENEIFLLAIDVQEGYVSHSASIQRGSAPQVQSYLGGK